jgi:hypothetical protein
MLTAFAAGGTTAPRGVEQVSVHDRHVGQGQAGHHQQRRGQRYQVGEPILSSRIGIPRDVIKPHQ